MEQENFKMKYAIIFLVLAVLAGCSQNQSKTKKATDSRIKQIQYLDAGHGLRLSVKDTTHTDSTTNYEVVASNDDGGGKLIGLMISIPKSTGKSAFGDGFTLKSIGAPSDYLLAILSSMYKQNQYGVPTFTNEVKAGYVDLQKMAAEYSKGEVAKVGADYKLFFDNNDDNEPAELYINVDPEAKWIEIKEKDPDYRTGIIKALTKKKE